MIALKRKKEREAYLAEIPLSEIEKSPGIPYNKTKLADKGEKTWILV